MEGVTPAALTLILAWVKKNAPVAICCPRSDEMIANDSRISRRSIRMFGESS